MYTTIQPVNPESRLITNASGGGLLSGAKDTAGFNLGQNVIIGGLAVQLVAFSVFVVVAFRFHRRISRFPTEASQTTRVPWQRFLYVLYAVSALILIRSIFRIIEYGQGWTGSLQDSEYWLYIFDAALMLSAMLLLNIWHPSRIISMGKREGLDSSDTEGCHQLRPPRATKH